MSRDAKTLIRLLETVAGDVQRRYRAETRVEQ
jgi:hypothetical protein